MACEFEMLSSAGVSPALLLRNRVSRSYAVEGGRNFS